MSLIRELRRRRAFRTVALYVVSAWVVLQVASVLLPALDIPVGAIRYVWIALTLGLPVAFAFGWRYQLTADGIVRTLPATAAEHPSLPGGNLSRRLCEWPRAISH